MRRARVVNQNGFQQSLRRFARRCGLGVGRVSLLVAAGDARRHDAHVTQSRVVVDRGVIEWRVRCFADDLEKGLRAFANAPTFVLTTDRRADSLVTAYFNARVFVDADGRRLRARLVERSREADIVGGAVQVYTLRLEAGAQPKSLTVRNALLFEQFRTEQNLVLVLVMPGGRRRSLYFAANDDSPQTVTF